VASYLQWSAVAPREQRAGWRANGMPRRLARAQWGWRWGREGAWGGEVSVTL